MVCGGAGLQELTAPITIRPAGAGDLDAVARIWHESAARMDAAASPMPSLSELRARIDAELAGGWQLYVAHLNGEPAGMLAIKPAEAILDQIFVAPDAQGRGVGAALLTVARDEMPRDFALRMVTANARAAGFYNHAVLIRAGDGEHPASGLPVTYFAGARQADATTQDRLDNNSI